MTNMFKKGRMGNAELRRGMDTSYRANKITTSVSRTKQLKWVWETKLFITEAIHKIRRNTLKTLRLTFPQFGTLSSNTTKGCFFSQYLLYFSGVKSSRVQDTGLTLYLRQLCSRMILILLNKKLFCVDRKPVLIRVAWLSYIKIPFKQLKSKTALVQILLNTLLDKLNNASKMVVEN